MDERLIEAIVEQVTRRLALDVRDGTSPRSSSIQSFDVPITDELRAGRVVVNTSARHVHLTDAHVEMLFGSGVALKPLRPLGQPGEFASEQQLVLVSPAGRSLGPVRVLGPTRKASQVEISLTDCITLGLKTLPPVRPSGDHSDTFGITLVGPSGAVTLYSGLIRANRHVHLHTRQAQAMGVRNNDYVDVRLDGDRPSVFLQCQVRAHDNFLAEMHIDTDDANSVGIKFGTMAQLLLKK